MAVNKQIGSDKFLSTVQSVFPTQFEPGSLADRLLIQGREEGAIGIAWRAEVVHGNE